MLVAILVLVILIGLSVACLLVKVERLNRESIKVITILRSGKDVEATIKDLEARGWIVKDIKLVEEKQAILYAITLFKGC